MGPITRATTTLNILRRVGGLLATALVTVQLQRGISSRVPGATGGGTTEESQRGRLPEPVANGVSQVFGATFWWVVGLTATGQVAGLFLPRHASAAAGPADITADITADIPAATPEAVP